MTPAIEFWAFVAFAAVVLVSGLAVVASRNLVRAAFWLLPCFLGVAGLFALLGSYFLAVVQVLIYAGAIMVLLLFVLMLTREVGAVTVASHNRQTAGAVIVSGLVAAVTLGVVIGSPWAGGASPTTANVADVGEALLRTYLLPFEAASVLLLAAIIGAIVIARSEPRS